MIDDWKGRLRLIFPVRSDQSLSQAYGAWRRAKLTTGLLAQYSDKPDGVRNTQENHMKTQFTGLLVTLLVAAGCAVPAVPVDQPPAPEGASNADR